MSIQNLEKKLENFPYKKIKIDGKWFLDGFVDGKLKGPYDAIEINLVYYYYLYRLYEQKIVVDNSIFLRTWKWHTTKTIF